MVLAPESLVLRDWFPYIHQVPGPFRTVTEASPVTFFLRLGYVGEKDILKLLQLLRDGWIWLGCFSQLRGDMW